jgi:Domain of unknown function (DUF4249)
MVMKNLIFTRSQLLLLVILVVWGCIKPYDEYDDAKPMGFLVVEGYLNASNGTCTIKLSRTQNLSSKANSVVESGASVSLLRQSGGSIKLLQGQDGKYTASDINPQTGEKFQLSIKTLSGGSYTSDLVEVIATPPIDSVTWRDDGDEIQFYVNTHDPAGAARYYRWEYDETYQYTSGNKSNYEYLVTNEIVSRREQIFLCWKDDVSRKIMIGTSETLNSDIIRDNNFAAILKSDSRFDLRYSMLLKQYAISKAEYIFLDNLKKNTQNLGTLFDPLPSEVSGNMHSDNGDEPVYGYFSAYDVKEKRIFVGFEYNYPEIHRGYVPCFPIDFVGVGQMRGLGYGYFNNVKLILDEVYSMTGALVGYNVALATCVDCRLNFRKGTNKKPEWWK